MGKLNKSKHLRVGSDLTGPVVILTANETDEAGGVLDVDKTNEFVGIANATPLNQLDIGGMGIKYVTSDEDVAIDGATTTTTLTPTGQVLGMRISVIDAITGLDSADHHIQIGVSGTTDKYIDVANGSAATSIAVNTKDEYSINTAKAADGGAIIFTITGGSDVTPTAGTVRIQYWCLNVAAIADV